MLRFSQFMIGVLIVVFLLLLRPQAAGGPAAYVTVDQTGLGSSLQPGDVAIVRRASSYNTGDLVAVQSRDGPAIFGRVAGHEDGTYRVRFHSDADSVAVEEPYVIGRLWFNLGRLGRSLSGSVLNYFKLEAEPAP